MKFDSIRGEKEQEYKKLGKKINLEMNNKKFQGHPNMKRNMNFDYARNQNIYV